MHLTIFLNGSDDAKQEKADLQKMKVNAMKVTKVRADGINFIVGRNGGHRPNSLGGRLIVVVNE